jgi:hypothetical protein
MKIEGRSKHEIERGKKERARRKRSERRIRKLKKQLGREVIASFRNSPAIVRPT